jgi:hypothetical protein
MIQVEVRATVAPDGRRMVLVQLPDGYVILTPTDTRVLALTLSQVADQLEGGRDAARLHGP